MKTDYDAQATEFLRKTNTSFAIEFLRYGKHFEDDTADRDIYKVTLTRGSRVFSFNFGQSLVYSGLKFKNKNTGRVYRVISTEKYRKLAFKNNKRRLRWTAFLGSELPFSPQSCDTFEFPKEPSAYDVLACLTKYDPGTFEDFCGDYGYDTDSRKAEKIYPAVVNEYQNVCMLWNDTELELLCEIQ